jgi:hypothetical protein
MNPSPTHERSCLKWMIPNPAIATRVIKIPSRICELPRMTESGNSTTIQAAIPATFSPNALRVNAKVKIDASEDIEAIKTTICNG